MPIPPFLIFYYLCAVNVLTFSLMGIDKRLARQRRRRISERTLFLFPLLGGAAGGCAGMFLVRHKTQHWYFRYGFPALLLLQLLALGVWGMRGG